MKELPYYTNGVDLTLEELLVLSKHTHIVKTNQKGSIASHLRGGSKMSRLKGRGMEFSEVREYDTHDDVRNIDWKVTAKKGVPHTKIFQEEVDRNILFCLDFGTRLMIGSEYVLQLIQSAHVVAVLSWFFSNQGDKIGGIITHEQQTVEIKEKARRKGVLQFFDRMINMYPQYDHVNNHVDYWQNTLLQLDKVVKPGTVLIVISNQLGFSPQYLDIILRYKRHADVKLFEITDPILYHLYKMNIAMPIIQNNRPLTWLSRKKIKSEYEKFQHVSQEIKDYIVKYKLNYTKISAAKPLEEQILVL